MSFMGRPCSVLALLQVDKESWSDLPPLLSSFCFTRTCKVACGPQPVPWDAPYSTVSADIVALMHHDAHGALPDTPLRKWRQADSRGVRSQIRGCAHLRWSLSASSVAETREGEAAGYLHRALNMRRLQESVPEITAFGFLCHPQIRLSPLETLKSTLTTEGSTEKPESTRS